MLKESEKRVYLRILNNMKNALKKKGKSFDMRILAETMKLWGFNYKAVESTISGKVEIWVCTNSNPHYCHLGNIEMKLIEAEK